MTTSLHRALKQTAPFASPEQQAFIGLQVAAQRVLDPWAIQLRELADLSPAQYNALRILRGAGEAGLTSGGVSDRLISRLPDVTRLLDRLQRRGLVKRRRSRSDRRVVRVYLSDLGLSTLAQLDEAADAVPRKLLGRLGAANLRQLNDLLGEIIAGAAQGLEV